MFANFAAEDCVPPEPRTSHVRIQVRQVRPIHVRPQHP